MAVKFRSRSPALILSAVDLFAGRLLHCGQHREQRDEQSEDPDAVLQELCPQSVVSVRTGPVSSTRHRQR